MKAPAVGIDVGTTQIKSCLMVANEVITSQRSDTPTPKALRLNVGSYWHSVASQLRDVLTLAPAPPVVAVVAQAPTICVWTEDEAIGLSYMTAYGDSTDNDLQARQGKTAQRLKWIASHMPPGQPRISGLTGYLVYRLTGSHTLDPVTAWEMGIEGPAEADSLFSRFLEMGCKPPQALPSLELLTPSTEWSSVLDHVITGGSDTAALPALFADDSCDFYLYLGTWGCLLKTNLVLPTSYREPFLSGRVNTWLVSVPNFAEAYAKDPAVLVALARDVSKHAPVGTIGVAGGVLLADRQRVLQVLERELGRERVVPDPHTTAAAGAALLAMAAVS